jgi:hypothetical protein
VVKVTPNGCFSDTVSLTVLPFIYPSITITAPLSVSIGQPVSVIASTINADTGYTINWYINGALYSTGNWDTLIYMKQGGADSIVAVIDKPNNHCYIPDTSNAVIVDELTSVSDPNTTRINIYPNPSNGLVFFSSPEPIQRIEINDMKGKLLLSTEPNNLEARIDLSDRAAGIYFYTVTANERSIRGKIMLIK